MRNSPLRERGANLIEYCMLVTFVLVVCYGAVKQFGVRANSSLCETYGATVGEGAKGVYDKEARTCYVEAVIDGQITPMTLAW